ncbi:alpha-glucuronidase family glycosyl hydrolase [Arcticibacter sp.]|uniref:alpha-glucuronidase family glycosyl hydrolase n=1 Tax=Arcticibacter sp. TaxID=1872630 RepID=UPI00388DB93F
MLNRILLILLILSANISRAEQGYNLWLRYEKIKNPQVCSQYKNVLKNIVFPGDSKTFDAARLEVRTAMEGLLDLKLPESEKVGLGTLLIGTPKSSDAIASLGLSSKLEALGNEGYLIRNVKVNNQTVRLIAANTEIGVLYGVFHFLRLMQVHSDIADLNLSEAPRIQHRVLNHWDNLNGTIERGYAGSSIWDWQMLPGYIDPRYIDYARANASIGINGAVLNNVNADSKSLTREYLIKTAAIADALRPYGVKVYLTAKFSAPKQIGGLNTADPLDPGVRQWWKDKAKEIYSYIPDFGGFLVKANSEGQPGPQDYKRTHADGANMMAEALEPYNGIVMWRAFVYENRKGVDRAKQAYDEFRPLDGKFNKNVLLQPKYGPIDFQPREAYHPLFGAMPETPLMIEFQLTQEYFGFSTNLVYLAPLFKEYLNTDTYAKGKGSSIAKVVSGELEKHEISGIAGVANIGSDINWTGHPFGQSNWYAFGRMAWQPDTDPASIAQDWIKMTFSVDSDFVEPVKDIMLQSREVAVNYMTPLGLNHIMNFATHYGPGPWYKDPNWDAWDYHHADSVGLGVDRTSTGSNAVSQYYKPLRDTLENMNTVPDRLLLWFHHVPWDHRMKSGNTLWNELVSRYYGGVESVKKMESTWSRLEGKIDRYRFEQVNQLLAEHRREAEWWRDGSVLYWQTFSKRPIPDVYKKPQKPFSHYRRISFPDRDSR